MMIRRRGFWPVGSGWGVRERFEDWIAEATGFMYCVCSCQPGVLSL